MTGSQLSDVDPGYLMLWSKDCKTCLLLAENEGSGVLMAPKSHSTERGE